MEKERGREEKGRGEGDTATNEGKVERKV